MTVAQLIVALQAVDQTRIVIIQEDVEGNSFSPLMGIDDNSVYQEDGTYSGDVKLQRLTPELLAQGFTAEDVGDGQPCLVLYPVN